MVFFFFFLRKCLIVMFGFSLFTAWKSNSVKIVSTTSNQIRCISYSVKQYFKTS
jgi:hypothetical protein